LTQHKKKQHKKKQLDHGIHVDATIHSMNYNLDAAKQQKQQTLKWAVNNKINMTVATTKYTI